ncbi:hypothetical protein [Acuticoccus sediminis]|uniref:hypothetical protein n=1 Tax=Acuticoccus sediminis TaxID=2184697 RepID=UPI001B3B7D0F|nr:hypothetical protein [Acuticoccus sediminis]
MEYLSPEDLRGVRPSCGRSVRSALVAAALIIAPGGVAQAASDSVDLPGDALFPENVAAAADGTLYVSGFVGGGVARVTPGAAKGKVFVAPGAFDTRSTFGLLPDAATGTLWVCSNDLTMLGIAGPSDVPGSHLKGFDLSTGAGKFSAKLPADPAPFEWTPMIGFRAKDGVSDERETTAGVPGGVQARGGRACRDERPADCARR